jgi:hypothetical protein
VSIRRTHGQPVANNLRDGLWTLLAAAQLCTIGSNSDIIGWRNPSHRSKKPELARNRPSNSSHRIIDARIYFWAASDDARETIHPPDWLTRHQEGFVSRLLALIVVGVSTMAVANSASVNNFVNPGDPR